MTTVTAIISNGLNKSLGACNSEHFVGDSTLKQLPDPKVTISYCAIGLLAVQ